MGLGLGFGLVHGSRLGFGLVHGFRFTCRFRVGAWVKV